MGFLRARFSPAVSVVHLLGPSPSPFYPLEDSEPIMCLYVSCLPALLFLNLWVSPFRRCRCVFGGDGESSDSVFNLLSFPKPFSSIFLRALLPPVSQHVAGLRIPFFLPFSFFQTSSFRPCDCSGFMLCLRVFCLPGHFSSPFDQSPVIGPFRSSSLSL